MRPQNRRATHAGKLYAADEARVCANRRAPAKALSVSPHKNAAKLNELGQAIAEEYGVKWLPSDFKKADGFRRSTALSAEYGMYRQDYCGCVFSRREAEARRAAQNVEA